MRTRANDQNKVKELMDSIKEIGLQVPVQEELNLVGGVKKQADKLKSNLIDIQSVLEDAERKQVKDKAVRVWLDKLKDVCYDMDDMLDEWSTAIPKCEMDEENTRSLKKMRFSLMGFPISFLKKGVQNRDIALKIKAINEKLDEIAKEKAMYGFELYKVADHQLPRLTSTSLVDEWSVCGRDGEKKSVVSKLLAESSQEAQDVEVISLVGLGGIGKTTLAQLVFNDAEVTTHFEKKIWVCVSEPFDEVRIAKAILEQLKGSTPNLVELQSLLPRAFQCINGKRVLIVLDDVWTEDHRQWEQLKPSLAGCARGSRILVTTRNGVVAKMMGTDHRIDIETLSNDASRSIFNQVAFHGRTKDEREGLTDIGNKIANKCRGLPLAAKVLGGLMQSKITKEEWEDVLSNELWRLDEVDKNQVEKQIFLPLLLSYYDLPFVARRCFLYCAMFPKDYEMNRDELVKMWMAQGYLKETPSRDMEVVGEQYFQVLVARSFFQDIKKSLNLSRSSIEEIPIEVGKLIHLRHLNLEGCRELVSLPETMYDLCNLQSLDVSRCLSLKELPRAIVKLIKLRHLRIDGSGVAFMPKGIERLTCLRTLDCFIVCGGGENESKAANLRELKNLDHIRGSLVIKNLRGGGIEDAAEAQLKNKKRLLCLELNFDSDSDGDILIEGLQPPSDLERLRIYKYRGIVLPNWMMALTRLQELTLDGCGNLEVLPPLGRLPNLERLVLQKVGVRRLDAGFLGIEEVENANNINEGEIARVTAFPKLKRIDIRHLYKLEEWDGIERRVREEDATTTSISIMPQLQQLRIHNCPLLRALPDYVLAASLQELRLIDCGNLEVLPPLGRLPNLERLDLMNVGVRRLDAGFLGIEEVENANINEGEIARVTAFPKLKTLEISNLFKLEEWDGIERRVGEEDATTTSIFIMPQLQHLHIYSCPLLRALPDYVLAASLQELRLIHCGNLEVLPPLGRLPNLESLKLMNVGVRRLDAGFVGIEEVENANINEGEIGKVTAFPKLKRLEIGCLPELEEWDGIERRVGEEDATTTSIFIIMPQLQHLEIKTCPLLRALPEYVLAASLQDLSELEEWDGIERRVGEEDATTTSIFIIMPQLQGLMIANCPLLRALPDYVLAASLQHLQLSDCGNLEVLPLLGRLPNLERLELYNLQVRRVGWN
uniref:NB-ARC domain-containing protein n=1 Tax=Salix viminalis TaxID=40686 RepID=A0A6N2MM48_SALVM